MCIARWIPVKLCLYQDRQELKLHMCITVGFFMDLQLGISWHFYQLNIPALYSYYIILLIRIGFFLIMLNGVFGGADITCKSLEKLTYSSFPAVQCVFLRLTEPSRRWGPQVGALAADPASPAFDSGSWQHGWVSRLHCGSLKEIPMFAAGLAWRPICFLMAVVFALASLRQV